MPWVHDDALLKSPVGATQVGQNVTPCAGCAARGARISCTTAMNHGAEYVVSRRGVERWQRIGRIAAIGAVAWLAAIRMSATSARRAGEIVPLSRDLSAIVSAKSRGANRRLERDRASAGKRQTIADQRTVPRHSTWAGLLSRRLRPCVIPSFTDRPDGTRCLTIPCRVATGWHHTLSAKGRVSPAANAVAQVRDQDCSRELCAFTAWTGAVPAIADFTP